MATSQVGGLGGRVTGLGGALLKMSLITRIVAAAMTASPQATTPKVQTREIFSILSTFLFTNFKARGILTLMSAILEEQTFTATRLDKEFPMGDDHQQTLELMDDMPLLEAMQHEVLMRNMTGFYA